MNRTVMAAAAGFLALVTIDPLYAADLPQPMYRKAAPIYAPYEALFTWQGFYAGFNGGYGFSSSTFTTAGGTSTVHPNGALLGSQVGYNFQAGSLVYGIEGDVDYSGMRKSNDVTGACPGCEVRNHFFATARGRLGYAVDRWLPYVTGGAAFGDIKTSTPAGGSQVTYKVGWTAGAGIEYWFRTSNWSTKVEYLYSDLGSANCDAAHCGASTDTNLRINAIRIGINYHY